MHRALFAFLFALLGCARLSAAEMTLTPEQRQAKRAAMLAQVADVAGLPRVLILGDSISMAYTPQVRAALAGQANVHRPSENCFDTRNGVEKLDVWLGAGKWDVIHFNFGLHDNNHRDSHGKLTPVENGRLTVTPELYGANLRTIVARLKRTGAILIFATTTPIPPGAVGRVPGAEVAYNQVAEKIMREAGVRIDDLHAFVRANPQPRPNPNDVHFMEKGNDALARLVAEEISAVLPAKK